MSKKDFIALADAIREHNGNEMRGCIPGYSMRMFNQDQIDVLAKFCRLQNGRFNRVRWLAYIAGECGPNGGKIKTAKPESGFERPAYARGSM